MTRIMTAILAVAALVAAAPAVGGERSRSKSEAPAGGGLKIEHLAFAYAGYYYLDGPAKQAACPIGRPGPGLSDEDGNVWFGLGGNMWGLAGGRCLEKGTGMVMPCFGDDYWCTRYQADEGPASAMFNMLSAISLGQPRESQFVWGSPLQGEDKGFLLFSDGSVVRKVFRNAAKDNRWWFRRIIGGGDKAPPKTKGGEVGALEASLAVNMVEVVPDGRIVVFAEGGFYELKGDKLSCLLGYDDYKGDGTLPEKNGKPDIPSMGVLGGDGAFYLGTYFGTGFGSKAPSVWRVPPGGKLEPYAWAVQNKHLDGPGMHSGAMCGHHIWARMHNYRFVPDDCLFLVAHDEFRIRRMRDGRVSTLCEDGEWREMPTVPMNYRWFHSWAPGPGGTATASSKTGGRFGSTAFTCIVSGIDYAKPTVGPAISTPGLPWPPPEGSTTPRQQKRNSKNADKDAAKEDGQ